MWARRAAGGGLGSACWDNGSKDRVMEREAKGRKRGMGRGKWMVKPSLTPLKTRAEWDPRFWVPVSPSPSSSVPLWPCGGHKRSRDCEPSHTFP
ncbi:unnamed protein product, partial [Discosporangium mesarthrocarpum]